MSGWRGGQAAAVAATANFRCRLSGGTAAGRSEAGP